MSIIGVLGMSDTITGIALKDGLDCMTCIDDFFFVFWLTLLMIYSTHDIDLPPWNLAGFDG